VLRVLQGIIISVKFQHLVKIKTVWLDELVKIRPNVDFPDDFMSKLIHNYFHGQSSTTFGARYLFDM
jgi:hypothetical protein